MSKLFLREVSARLDYTAEPGRTELPPQASEYLRLWGSPIRLQPHCTKASKPGSECSEFLRSGKATIGTSTTWQKKSDG